MIKIIRSIGFEPKFLAYSKSRHIKCTSRKIFIQTCLCKSTKQGNTLTGVLTTPLRPLKNWNGVNRTDRQTRQMSKESTRLVDLKNLLSLATTILQTLKSFLKAVGQTAMQSYEEDCFCKKKIKIEWMSEFIYNAHWPWVIPQRTIYFLRASISFWQHDVSTKKVDSTFLRKQNSIYHCLSLPILVYRVCFELNFSYSLFKYNSWI